MTELEDVPDGVDLSRGQAELAAATRQLREVPASPRAVEIADRILQRALAAPRRSVLVRAAAPLDHLRVSSVAITAIVRQRLDDALEGAAVRRVVLDVDPDGQLRSLTVDLVVQYGTVVLDLGEQARRLALEVLAETLGHPDPAAGVSPPVVDVHVGDVTTGDPHVVDPSDESTDAH